MKKLIHLLCLLPVMVMAQTNTQNYLKTLTYRLPTTTSDATKAQSDITYYDGIGRPVQQISGQSSATGKDIYTHIEYDGLGRQVKSYMPFPATTNNLAFVDGPSLKTNTLNYYNTAAFGNTSNPYSETVFEVSPMGRVIKEAAPGDDWKVGSSTDHTVKTDYMTNTDTEVKKMKAIAGTLTNGVYSVSFNSSGNYSAGQLYKTVSKNENWTSGTDNTTEVFKDKEGRIILSRTYDGTIVYNTYYVYDQYGNLSYVLPPATEGTTTYLSELCYQYKYDTRNRVVEKKMPGKQWEFIVYDKADRPVATGPALSPFGGTSQGWLITKYDTNGRIAYTGWYAAPTFTSATRNAMQNNTFSNVKMSTTPIVINGVSVNYLNSFPTSMDVLSVNYYDNYIFTTAPTPTATIAGQDVQTNVTGLPIASWTRVLTAQSDVLGTTTYIYYDKKNRPIRTMTENYLSGNTMTDSNYDFDGSLVYTSELHRRTHNDTDIETRQDFTYTAQDRLQTHSHKINNLTPQILSNNTYNELGQLTSQLVGGTGATGTVVQGIDYKYNVRGWLTDINNVDGFSGQSGIPTDLFAYRISYNSVNDDIDGNIKAQYNGNIAETYWRSYSDDVLRKYSYKYDKQNRLNKAFYQKFEDYQTYLGSYDEEVTYDKNGNIKTLKRNGAVDDYSTNVAIDDLTYSYTTGSNKLSKIVDGSPSPQGFKDINDSSNSDYTYDVNGNIKTDKNKGITSITYNHLNLPVEIVFNNSKTDKIIYLYDAAGAKIQKTLSEGQNSFYIDYLGGYQYKNATLQFFSTGAGYAERTLVGGSGAYSYVFQYQDHLGNVRMNFAAGKYANTAVVKEENNYYPLGLKHQNYNMTYLEYQDIEGELELYPPVSSTTKLKYNYRYNAQEFEGSLGLNMNEMDFRQYDPAIGRFVAIDALAPMSSSMSPYHFAKNNSVFFSDPSGLDPSIGTLIQNLANSSFGEVTTWFNDNNGMWQSAHAWYDQYTEQTHTGEHLPELEIGEDYFGRTLSETLLIKMEDHVRANGKYYADWRKKISESRWDDLQTGLDYVGAIPLIGEPVDLINAGISVVRGNYSNAALSVVAMAPIVGWGAMAVKIQTHHIIPKAVYREAGDALKKVIDLNGGFNLKKIPFPFHGNHPQYSKYVTRRLEQLSDISPGSIKALQKDLNSLINNAYDNWKSTGENLNDYFRKLNGD